MSRRFVVFVALLVGLIGLTQSAQAAQVIFVDPPSLNFASVAAGASKQLAVTVSNTGDSDLTVTNITITGANAGAFGETDDCSAPIIAGGSCEIDVTFSPPDTGNFAASLNIFNDSTDNQVNVPLSGSAFDPVTVTPGSLDFGTIGAGETSPSKPVTVTNDPDAAGPLHIGTITFAGANPGAFDETDNCGTVAAGDSCQINVTFSPGSAADFSASLVINDDAPTSPQHAGLSGTAIDPVSVTPATLPFGTVKLGAQKTLPVTVKNLAHRTLNVTSLNVGGDYSVQPGDNGCAGSPLGFNGTCSITVTFSPSNPGASNNTLTVNTDAVTPPKTVSLTGTGGQGSASFTPAGGLDFAEVPVGQTSAPKTVTVNNDGNATLVVSSVALSTNPAGQFAITGGSCVGGDTVAPGDGCTVTITFTPNAGVAVHGALTVNDDGASHGTYALDGTGAVAGINPDPNPVAFAAQQDGTVSLVKTVTIQNTGNAALVLGTITIAGTNPLSFVKNADTCSGATIAPTKTCTVGTRFSPVGRGAKSGTLHVPSNVGAVDVLMSGSGTPPPDVVSLHASVGCFSANMTWAGPGAAGFVGTRIVRNAAHVPTGPNDGTIVEHGSGVLNDTGRAQFTTYNYAVFATYKAWNSERQVFATGLVRTLRTQRICSPQLNQIITDLTPKVDWTPVTGTSYAIRLNHNGVSILVRYSKLSEYQIPTSWTYLGTTHRLAAHSEYFLYVYVYNSQFPKGHLIGSSNFSEK